VSSPRKTESLVDAGFHALEGLLVLVLAIMLVMVFANVVLRYGFNSGITVTEEVSRLMFVWLTFLGAVPVMRQHGHLGVEMLVGVLSGPGRLICRVVSDVLIIGCCVVFGWGAWEQTQLNLTNYAPASGIPSAWAYGAAVVAALGIGLLTFADLFGVLRRGAVPDRPRGHGYEP
jgi:TRAP-type C4-dicarboxylate transport system permease small subunit